MLLVVIGVSLVLGLATVWLVDSAMWSSFDRLSALLDEVDRGGVIVAAQGSRDLDALSVRLAET